MKQIPYWPGCRVPWRRFTGSDPSYALVQSIATGQESLVWFTDPTRTVTFSLWIQFTGVAPVQSVFSCPSDSLFFGLEFGSLVLRVAGSISPVFTLPAPPLGVWTSMSLLFAPQTSGSSAMVQFVQNGDVLFVGPLPAGFPLSLQCDTIVIGAVQSPISGNSSSAQYATQPSYSQVSPPNPSIRSLLQANIDSLPPRLRVQARLAAEHHPCTA